MVVAPFFLKKINYLIDFFIIVVLTASKYYFLIVKFLLFDLCNTKNHRVHRAFLHLSVFLCALCG